MKTTIAGRKHPWITAVAGVAFGMLLALHVTPAVGAIVVGEAVWAPGIEDWRTPLGASTPEPRDGDLSGAYLLAGGPPITLDADALLPGTPPLTAAIALRFNAGAREADREQEVTPDLVAYVERIARLPGFNEIEEIFITRLSASDWLQAETEAAVPAAFTNADIPIWTPIPEPGELLMLAAALAVLLTTWRLGIGREGPRISRIRTNRERD